MHVENQLNQEITINTWATIIESTLNQVQEQYDALFAARHRPNIFDECIVSRILDTHKNHLISLTIYKEKSIKEQHYPTTISQSLMDDFLNTKINQIEVVLNDTYLLINDLAGETVEKISNTITLDD